MIKKISYIFITVVFLFVLVLVWRYTQIQKSDALKLSTTATTSDTFVVATTTQNPTPEIDIYETAFAHNIDMFSTVSVSSGDTIKPKTKVTGEVRGNWYFEASFPVELRTGTSTVVWSGVAQAQGNWMTTNFVPFSVVLNYTPFGTSTPAILVLKKDNPSGDPANDDELLIPVVLQ